MSGPDKLTLVEHVRQKLKSHTPEARLRAHLEYWAENDPPEKVKGLLESAQAMHEASPNLAPPKLKLILGELRAEMLLHEWMNDPDTLRGEKTGPNAGLRGAEQRWADTPTWGKRQGELQAEVDRLHALNPRLSRTDLIRATAKKFGCSESTVKRLTSNPRGK